MPVAPSLMSSTPISEVLVWPSSPLLLSLDLLSVLSPVVSLVSPLDGDGLRVSSPFSVVFCSSSVSSSVAKPMLLSFLGLEPSD